MPLRYCQVWHTCKCTYTWLPPTLSSAAEQSLLLCSILALLPCETLPKSPKERVKDSCECYVCRQFPCQPKQCPHTVDYQGCPETVSESKPRKLLLTAEGGNGPSNVVSLHPASCAVSPEKSSCAQSRVFWPEPTQHDTCCDTLATSTCHSCVAVSCLASVACTHIIGVVLLVVTTLV